MAQSEGIKIAVIQTDVSYLRSKVDTMSQTLADLVNTLPSLHQKIDLANERTTENKLKIERDEKRIKTIEIFIQRQKWERGLIGASFGLFGISGIALFRLLSDILSKL